MVAFMVKQRLVLTCIAVFSLVISTVYGADEIKIGVLPVLDTLPLHVAKQEGYFAAEDLAVDLIPFASAMERNMALHSGQLHGFFGDIPATLLLVKTGIPLKFLTVSYSTTPGQRMFGLLLSEQKANATGGELTVAISKGSIIEYLLDMIQPLPAVSSYTLNAQEIKQMPVRMQMLATGQIDAALLPEPLLTLAESKGAKLILTDEQLNIPLTVLNLHASKSILKDRFLSAYNKAADAINQNGPTYKNLLIKTGRIPPHLADRFIQYKFHHSKLPTESEVNAVQIWMIQKNLLDQNIPYLKLIQ